MEGWAVGYNFERGPPKDHPSHIWFNLVQQENFYQNMYKSAERNISQKNPEYMLNYLLSLAAVNIRAHFNL